MVSRQGSIKSWKYGTLVRIAVCNPRSAVRWQGQQALQLRDIRDLIKLLQTISVPFSCTTSQTRVFSPVFHAMGLLSQSRSSFSVAVFLVATNFILHLLIYSFSQVLGQGANKVQHPHDIGLLCNNQYLRFLKSGLHAYLGYPPVLVRSHC